MKVKILKDHSRVIAVGTVAGRRIKAIAVCNDGDKFDENFGVELAKRKYKIVEKAAKRDLHKKNIRMLTNMIRWCQTEIDTENRVIDQYEERIDNMVVECSDFVNNYFSG